MGWFFWFFFQETTTIKSTFLVAFVPKILQHASVQWLENSSLLFPSPASLLTFHFVSRFPLLFPTTKQIDPDLHACLTLFTSVSCPWQQKLVTAASVSPRVHWGLQLSPGTGRALTIPFFFFFYSVFKIVQGLQCGNYSQGNGRDLTFPLVRNS